MSTWLLDISRDNLYVFVSAMHILISFVIPFRLFVLRTYQSKLGYTLVLLVYFGITFNIVWYDIAVTLVQPWYTQVHSGTLRYALYALVHMSHILVQFLYSLVHRSCFVMQLYTGSEIQEL